MFKADFVQIFNHLLNTMQIIVDAVTLILVSIKKNAV